MFLSGSMRLSKYGMVFAPVVTLLLAACADQPHVRISPTVQPVGIEAAPNARWIRVQGTNGRQFLTAILRPQGSGPFPVVIVLHGNGGLGRFSLALGEELARAGFLTVVGCWLAGEAQTAGNAICAEATPQANWIADPAANSGKELIAATRLLPDALADRIGLFGFSRGGHAALWAASTGAGVKAVVVDAPAHRPPITPAPPATVTVVSQLSVPLLILHGMADTDVPVEQSQEYELVARALGKSVSAVYFDEVGHGTTFDPKSAPEARRRAIAFFRETL